MEPTATTIDLLRHGEPQGGHRFRGSTDDPLSDAGWQQMRTAVADAGEWDRVVTSPLSRCRLFAEEIARDNGLPLRCDDNFRELHFGDWEGEDSKLLWRDQKERLMAFFMAPEANPPPGGETLKCFADRLTKGWTSLLEQERDQHVLLVCHGGVIRLLMAQVLGVPLKHYARFDVPYASMTRLRIFHSDQGDIPLLLWHGRAPAVAAAKAETKAAGPAQ